MIKAILFDFDGLLVDSQPLQYESVRKTLEDQGVILTKKKFIEEWVKKLKDPKQVIKNYNLKISPEEYKEKKENYYQALVKKIKLSEGSKEFLIKSKNSFKTALVTHSRRKSIELILNQFNIINYFDLLITREDYKNNKPNPEPYLIAAKKLSVSPKECLVFEDSAVGLESAYNAGMKCIIIPNEFTKDSDFKKAYKILNSFNDIKDINDLNA